MKARFIRQQAPAAPWCRRGAFFSLTLFLVSGAGHRFGLLETVPFFWLLGIAGALSLASLVLGGIALVQVWEHGSSGASVAAGGIFVAVIALTPYGVSAYRFFEHPPLMDISSDLDDPPKMPLAAGARTGAMNALVDATDENRDLQHSEYPEIAGRRYEHTAEKVVEVVHLMMEERGWQPKGMSKAKLAGASVTLEGLAHSYFLGFPADVAIRIEDDQTATFVEMRSASRYGRHDLGDNAARIKRFLNELDERLALLAAV
ncbi:DUF1499 domain-containing protein [Nitratireductor sp. GISD-1A_MAKvit]|uniref:DUF1499 domain-containing protein n=1 Tax=Nitratireductor sp. GISD-1A_MAKvit TaxID=3234198 RepID=UPI0034664407